LVTDIESVPRMWELNSFNVYKGENTQ